MRSVYYISHINVYYNIYNCNNIMLLLYSYYGIVVATAIFELRLRGVPGMLNLYCCSVMTLKNKASYISVLYIK